MVLGGIPDVMGTGDHNLFRVHSIVMRAHNLFSSGIYVVRVWSIYEQSLG